MFSRSFLLLDVSRICRENVFPLNQTLISRSTRVYSMLYANGKIDPDGNGNDSPIKNDKDRR